MCPPAPYPAHDNGAAEGTSCGPERLMDSNMEKKRQYLGKWELGCMVFNSCLYKIFTTYPRSFGQISGSAGWLTALYTGLIFLAVLFLLLTLLRRHEDLGLIGLGEKWGGRAGGGLIRIALAVYWIASAVYALRECTTVLRTVSYAQSPAWFLMFFFILGAAATAVCGARAVYRMHSLTVLFVGLVAAAVAVLGLKYAEPLYLAPVLGSGPQNVFGKGLSTLFLYTDVIFVFLLTPWRRPEIKVRRTVMAGAALAVAVNVGLILVSSMAQPYEMAGALGIPIYPLTKAAYFGKFWSRMDAVYLTAFIISGILYLALALHLIALCAKGLKMNSGGKKAAAGVLCALLCISLSSCYDGREIEEGADLVALGVDKGQTAAYRYTFQLSNPLEMGDNLDATGMGGRKEGEGEAEEPEQAGGEQENKTVNNMVIEADDFYLAENQLKSHLSKHPELSHLKVIVFSKDLAREGLLEHASLLFREREVRPSTNLCLAESAQTFLTQVKPTLEQSTSRYYELLFQNQNTPYAPVTELREFVSRGMDSAQDPVLPIADQEKLMGMGIFHDGKLVAEAEPEQALLYKLLSGEARHVAVRAGESSFSVTSRRKPKIQISWQEEPPRITVSTSLKADLIYGSADDGKLLAAQLEEEMTQFLQDNVRNSADILGIGCYARLQCLTESDWEKLNWEQKFSNFTIFTKTSIKIGENVENLQKQ